jgi:hypothetical protein
MITKLDPKTPDRKSHKFLRYLEHRLDVWLSSVRSSRWDRSIWWGRRAAKGRLFEEARLVPKAPRAEAIRLVMRCLLPFIQVADGCRVLRYRAKLGVDRKWIARVTGLRMGRVKRAIADLTHAGLLGGYQPREKKPDGEVRGRPAVRWINQKLLAFLGIWDELVAARKHAAKRAPVERRPQLPTRIARNTFAALALRLRV